MNMAGRHETPVAGKNFPPSVHPLRCMHDHCIFVVLRRKYPVISYTEKLISLPMTPHCEEEISHPSQSALSPVPVQRSGNHKIPSTFWFVIRDGRAARAVLTRYRRRRLVKLGYACAVRTGYDRYPQTLPDCTVIIDDGPA